MVKLSESAGKPGESFARIFGNDEMGQLFSRLQSAIIRAGLELEGILEQEIPSEIVTTLPALTTSTHDLPAVQVVFKPARTDPDSAGKKIEADLLVIDNQNRVMNLVEVKEGHVFDTKKADGELASLKSITSWLAQEFPYRATYYLCAFNQEDKQEIVNGAKRRFTVDHVLTGRELCEMVGIDYDAICESRKRDQLENRTYFLTELLRIPEIRAEVETILKGLA
jgi:hypothetical protein